MTHNDIYKRFLIEYDKANVTSSYPSLTTYEAAVILDKAYNALISQKLTGNNLRRAFFEADVKAVADLQPLIKHQDIQFQGDGHFPIANIARFVLPTDFNYYVQAYLNYRVKDKPESVDDRVPEPAVYSPTDSQFESLDNDDWVRFADVYNDYVAQNNTTSTEQSTTESGTPYDRQNIRLVPMKLVPHTVAEKFFVTPYNMPWVKNPVCYMEGNLCFVVYDMLNKPEVSTEDVAHLVYIKKPISFVANLKKTESSTPTTPDEPISDPGNDTPTQESEYFTLNVSSLNSNKKIK